MATIINQTLGGIPIYGAREFSDKFELNAIFGLNAQPSLNIEKWVFSNNDKSLNSDILRNFHDTLPTEGAIFGLEITDGVNSFPFKFVCDYNNYSKLNASETEVGLKLVKSIDSLIDLQGEDITMLLLEVKNFLATADYVNHPYVVENRKTILEKMQILAQFVFVSKTGFDEIFKIINIAADITTAGVVQALVNLGTTALSLTAISLQIKVLIEEIQANFFPPIKYHSAIEHKQFIKRACDYLGYGVNFGTWTENTILLPSKNDEEGNETPDTTSFQSGILNSDDFGYNLKDSFQLARQMANVDLAIIDNVLHCRPKSDPFWLLASGYVMPDVLVEQSPMVQNGTRRNNREDLVAGTITKFVKDSSDKWTIQKLANDNNGDRISTTIVTPVTVLDTKNININGVRENTIPYCLAVRKSFFNDLEDAFKEMGGAFQAFVDAVEENYGSVEEFTEHLVPALSGLKPFLFDRDGALRVENDFFDKPKVSILENNVIGKPRIPENFNDLIGAKAIYNKYFKWDSMVAGVRDPANPSNTNAKEIFTDVKFGFNISDFNTILDKGYFTTKSGKIGKFISLKWNVQKDLATATYWVQDNWATNIEETVT